MAFTVNGELVEDSVVRAEIRALRPRYEAVARGMDPVEAETRLRSWSRENVIERVLLRQEAASDPEPIPPEAVSAEPDAEIALRVDRLLARITSKVSPPKHKEITDYYRKHKQQLLRPESVRAAHIIKIVDETQDEAAALVAIHRVEQEIKDGASFEKLAEQLGWIPRGQTVSEFEDVIFSLKDNEVSEIFRTKFGFHIAKAYGRKPEGISEFDEVRESIEKGLYDRKKERVVEGYLDRLKAKAVIVEVPRD